MDPAFILSTLLKSGAAAANVFVVASSLGMPLQTVEKLVSDSPLFTFFFLFAFSLSVSDSYIPALIGTLIYFIIEFDSLVDSYSQNQGIETTKKPAFFRKLKLRF
jgi:hypothetical protein